MRVVLDTNILIRALISKGSPPDRLYQAWLRGGVELVTSKTQIRDRKGMLDLQSIEAIPIMTAQDALELVTGSPDSMT
ncbi:MAG: PIN domain-containing protein [Gammaproteobacteria bacterium]|nr:PIN domain-containing protein [Gammaproteobacteria bacterium]